MCELYIVCLGNNAEKNFCPSKLDENGAIKYMKSHIQLPHFILRKFEDEKNNLYYIDIDHKCMVKKGHAASLNTKANHYSAEVESYLSNEIEHPFSEEIKRIEKTIFDQDGFSLSFNLEVLAKKYAISCFARSSHMKDLMWDSSIYAQFMKCTEQNQNDLAVLHGTISNHDSIFESYFLTFGLNRSNKAFVVPMTGLYGMEIFGGKVIVMPISPKLVLILIDSAISDHIVENGITKMIIIENDDIIYDMNKRALATQKEQGYGFVAGSSREELSELAFSEKVMVSDV